jgi:hypothetical protein
MEAWLRTILTSVLFGGDLSALRPGRFTPELGAPGTYWIEGWVGPRTGLNGLAKRKLFALAGSRTSISLGRPACGLVIITDSGRTAYVVYT